MGDDGLEQIVSQGVKYGTVTLSFEGGSLSYSAERISDPAYLKEQRACHEAFADYMRDRNQKDITSRFAGSESFRKIFQMREDWGESPLVQLISKSLFYVISWCFGESSPQKIFSTVIEYLARNGVTLENEQYVITEGSRIFEGCESEDAKACLAYSKDILFSYRQLIERQKTEISDYMEFYRIVMGKELY